MKPPTKIPKSMPAQLNFVCSALERIEQGLATLAKNQVLLEHIVETKIHEVNVHIDTLAVDVIEIKERLKELDAASDKDDEDVGKYECTPRTTQPRTHITVRSTPMPVITPTA